MNMPERLYVVVGLFVLAAASIAIGKAVIYIMDKYESR
jgi:hypothetical protein